MVNLESKEDQENQENKETMVLMDPTEMMVLME